MIGIIAAMDVEVQAIEKLCQIQSAKKIGLFDFVYGTCGGVDVVLCKSGVGKVGAAMVTTALCLTHDLEALINIGTAGGLKEEQDVLDIVISEDVIQADFDTTSLDGPEGLGLRYRADRDLIQKAVEAAQENEIRYHVGTIASQDLFMAKEEDFQKLIKNFPDSICSEMEAGALAQVADAFQIPFVIIRSLSDVAVHHDNPMEFSTYVQHASKQSSHLVESFLKKL